MDTDHSITNQVYNLNNLEPNFRMYLSEVKEMQPVSVKNYLSDLRHFLGWFGQSSLNAPRQFEVITTDNALQYRDFLIDSGLPFKTVNRRLSALRAFCSFMLSQSLISENPMKGVVNYYPNRALPTKESDLRTDLFNEGILAQFSSGDEAKLIVDDVDEFLKIVTSHSS